MEPVLKFVNVNKYYNNNVHALHNISLEIAAGEFISVIGPSGSGKSTLLRTVNRLIDVSDGEICLDGENITNIGGKKLRAISLLEEMGLGAFCYNRAADLSGGQKQRVGIARAIMQRPKIMLADEPIASLDPSSAKNIMDILAGLVKDRQITCIVNLHQLEVAKKYSTRIIGLSKGTIVFDGKPEELTDEVVEKIYGTSSANLIGGAESEEQHISYAAC